MTSVDPLTFYIFDEGIVRMATEKYQIPKKSNINNQYIHLTNYSINKNSPYFFSSNNQDSADTGFKRSIKFLRKYLK